MALSVKQPRLGAASLFHILFAAVLISLLLQPACARAINADRRSLATTDYKVTKLVANQEAEMIKTEDKPVGGDHWGGGGGGYGHGGGGYGHGGGGYGHGGGGYGHGGGGWGGGGGGYGHGGGGCCDNTAHEKP